MVLAVVVLLGAVLLGWAFGGRVGHLADLPLRQRWLIIAALLVQAGGAVVGGVFYPVGLAVSVVLAGAFLLRNKAVRGVGLIALGLLSNAVVVGVNGHMPVSVSASGRAGISTQDILAGADPRHEIADSTSRLRPLSDVIPVVLPVRPEVISIGDLLVAAGLAQLVFLGMGSRARMLSGTAREE